MEKSCVALVFVWKCRQGCLGRAVVVPADAILIPTIVVTSVEREATMRMTATASTREEVVVVAGLAPGPDLVPGLGPVGVATALAPVAVAMTAAPVLHPTPSAGAGLAPRPVPISPELQ